DNDRRLPARRDAAEMIEETKSVHLGLRICERQAPLAVVLDLQMPEMDGFGFLDHFRRIPSCRKTPVIVWTVKDLTRDDYARLQSSAQGVIGKGQSSATSVVEELRRFLSGKAVA